MSEHCFVDFTRANYPCGDHNGVGVAIVHGAIHAWEKQHNAKVSVYNMIERSDLGNGIVELEFTEVEYLK